MRAWIDGPATAPAVHLATDWRDTHASSGAPIREWIKTLPERRWQPQGKIWTITGWAEAPDALLRAAGFVLTGPDGIPCPADGLHRPLLRPRPGDADGLWEVHARLYGHDRTSQLVPTGTLWRASETCWLLDPRDLADTTPFEVVDPAALSAALAVPKPVGDTTADRTFVYDHTLSGLRGLDISLLHSLRAVEAESLRAVGIENVYDLLTTVPRRYLNLRDAHPFTDDMVGTECAIVGTVTKLKVPREKGRPLQATITDDNGIEIRCTWFRIGVYKAKQIPLGTRVVAFGDLEWFKGRLSMTNPLTEAIVDDAVGTVMCIYPQSTKNNLSTWTVRRAAIEACERLGTIHDSIPGHLSERHGLMPLAEALYQLHCPDDPDTGDRARDRLAWDELMHRQLVLATMRAQRESEPASQSTEHGLADQWIASLPYPLTGDQQRCVDEIRADMAAKLPMSRVLQGDVGMGKTLPSIVAMLDAVASGHQAVLLAPTEVLARQHYREIAEVTEQMGLTCAFVSGKAYDVTPQREAKSKAAYNRSIRAGLADGSIQIAVGTHALFSKAVSFDDLGLVVIDEQHRFGVEQRAKLVEAQGRTPDLLMASATPISRTVLAVAFGDMPVSFLREYPAGRGERMSHWIDRADADRPDNPVWQQVRDEVASGRQAFVVVPMVESEIAMAASAQATADALSAGALSGLRVGVATGKTDPDEMRATMAAMAAGELDVLVATTVIEVGVNVPNATVMVVLDADHFGISQLHQLRGRVGRGKHPGTFWLVCDPYVPDKSTGELKLGNPKTAERLQLVATCDDGFALAEADFAARGAGSLTGSTQSGNSSGLRIARIARDGQLLDWAKADATELAAADPHLSGFPQLRAEILADVGEEGAQFLLRA